MGEIGQDLPIPMHFDSCPPPKKTQTKNPETHHHITSWVGLPIRVKATESWPPPFSSPPYLPCPLGTHTFAPSARHLCPLILSSIYLSYWMPASTLYGSLLKCPPSQRLPPFQATLVSTPGKTLVPALHLLPMSCRVSYNQEAAIGGTFESGSPQLHS